VGVDLGNLVNTNYTTTYENIYRYSVGNTAMGGTWNNATAIYTPRFVRWNLDGRLLTILVGFGIWAWSGTSYSPRNARMGATLSARRAGR